MLNSKEHKVYLIVWWNSSLQSYWEITSESYFEYIKEYVVGIGPWKDTVVPPHNNYLSTATDLVAKAHAYDLQVRFLSNLSCEEMQNLFVFFFWNELIVDLDFFFVLFVVFSIFIC